MMDISAKNKLCIGHIGSKMTELAKSIDSLRAVACTAKERFTRYNELAVGITQRNRTLHVGMQGRIGGCEFISCFNRFSDHRHGFR